MIHWTDFIAGFSAGCMTVGGTLKYLTHTRKKLHDKEIDKWEQTRDQREIEQAMRQKRVWQIPESKE
jgi:hypothetical protein